MNRIAVFAHYSEHNTIENFVLYYLKELSKVTDKIIFVSDNDLDDTELEKIKPLVAHFICQKHGEYDFGSYKRGYLYAYEQGLLNKCDELIFANDSCYAPLYPFENMFSVMSPKPLDFWGVTSNQIGYYVVDNELVLKEIKHIQSYFIVFKPSVFNSELFLNFIKSIKHEDYKKLIIAKYEVGMTKMLEDNGYKCDVYCQTSKEKDNTQISEYNVLITKDKSPFLKRSIVLYKNVKEGDCYPIFIRKLIKNTNYNYNYIRQDKKHNALKLRLYEHIECLLKIWKQIKPIKIRTGKKAILIICGKTIYERNS